MKNKIKQRILESLSWSEETLNQLIFATPDTALHDPFLYTNMERLIDELHAFKLEQDKDPSKLLVVDPDYDTDGIMSAAVLTAALSLFNINHRVYIPSMQDGYGLSPKAVDDMLNTYSDVSLILTADNGTNAFDGIDYANSKGIKVLVTDHHLGSTQVANADVVVNPNVPTDFYPFKGNAGATVAWKTMTAYANKYAPQWKKDIYRLVVFAGIANVADVMPILDENHFMVKEAMMALNKVQDGNHLPKTGVPGYDNVMDGLYDLVTNMQQIRNEKRKAEGKKPSYLPTDEQLIGWYISPLLNAPRRVVGTPTTAFKGLMHADPNVREANIRELTHQNELKSKLRDEAIASVDPATLGTYSNVITVNAPHGIAGLVAGSFAGRTQKATIVFAFDPRLSDDKIISGSARSTEMAPLPMIIERIEQLRPGTVVGGGGHAQAAGYAIRKGDLEIFRELFDQATTDVLKEVMSQLESVPTVIVPMNRMTFAFTDGEDTDETLRYNVSSDMNLAQNVMDVLNFFDELKPFGKGFEAETKFTFLLDPFAIQEYNYNPNFWKTFKAEIYGVEVLTFDTELAHRLKTRIEEGNDGLIVCKCELKRNEFMGRVKPQMVLSLSE